MYHGKPIIGLVGGIGSGKSYIARCFAEARCYVIDSDAQVRQAYRDPKVIETVRKWWGPEVILATGQVDRAFIAKKVFDDPAERVRLEQLLHPWVNAAREREMAEAVKDPLVLAFVWDAPLLLEAGLAEACDVVVYVDTPLQIREERVRQTRGWDARELQRRENLQQPLDKKREIADYVLSNAADAAQARDQVRDLIPQILAQIASQSATGGH